MPPPPGRTTTAAAPRTGAPLDAAAIYDAHARSVERWVRRLGGPSCDVEDLVHDVFIAAFKQLDRFRGEAQVSTWLFRITERTIRRRMRRERLRRMLLRPFGGEQEPADDAPSAPERLTHHQDVKTLYRALDELPEKYRTALILFELEGLAGEQIAEMTGISVANVWARVHRGRERLQKALREAAQAPETRQGREEGKQDGQKASTRATG